MTAVYRPAVCAQGGTAAERRDATIQVRSRMEGSSEVRADAGGCTALRAHVLNVLDSGSYMWICTLPSWIGPRSSISRLPFES